MKAVTFTDFCGQVLGLRLTPGQRVIARVLFDRVEPASLRGNERDLARQLFGRVDRVPATGRAIAVIVAGARSGKSRLGALRLLHLALTCPLDSLAPGERAGAVIVAPDARLARQALRFALGAAKGAPSIAPLVQAETHDSFALKRPDGQTVVIECLPATRGGGAVRGRTLVGALLDELAFFRDSDSVVNDVDVFTALTPRLHRSGQLICSSTPWGESGLLFELHRDNFGKPATCLVAHAPTLLLRDEPDVVAMVERERLRDPRNALLEFDAQFGSNESNLLESADVDGCVDDRESSPIERGKKYCIGLDLGVRVDSTAFVRAHREIRARPDGPPAEYVVIDQVFEYRPKFFAIGKVDLDRVEEDLAREAKAARAKVAHDIYLSDSFAPRLTKRGVTCVEISMSSAEQARRAALLAALVRDRRLRLPRHPELIRQLKNLRITRHAGGRITVAAPGRKHDDLADACILALDGARELPVSGGDVYRKQSLWVNFAADGALTSPDSGWYERLPDGGERRVEAPVGSVEYDQARDARLRRGIYNKQDLADLGEAEVFRRLNITVQG